MFDFETFADVVGCYVAGACEVVSTSGSSSIRFDEEESCVGRTVLREPLRFMTRFTGSLQCSSRFDNQVVEDPSREQHVSLPLRLMQPRWSDRFCPYGQGDSSWFLPEKARPMSSVGTAVMKTGSTLPDEVPVPVHLLQRWEQLLPVH